MWPRLEGLLEDVLFTPETTGEGKGNQGESSDGEGRGGDEASS